MASTPAVAMGCEKSVIVAAGLGVDDAVRGRPHEVVVNAVEGGLDFRLGGDDVIHSWRYGGLRL